jgi:hypothetical protein
MYGDVEVISKYDNVISAIMEAMSIHTAAGLNNTALNHQANLAYWRKTEDCMQKAATAFGELNDWQLVKALFPLEQIGKLYRPQSDVFPFMEHSFYYRQRRINIAIVGQTYTPLEESRRFLDKCANEYNVRWHVPPAGPYASFRCPGRTLFVVMTLPEIEVQWLPEQIKPNPLDQMGERTW